jgi:hypothetical protein
MKFWNLFFISLDRNEVFNWAGSGLFFILLTFTYLNFKKVFDCVKDPFEFFFILELLPFGGFFVHVDLNQRP